MPTYRDTVPPPSPFASGPYTDTTATPADAQVTVQPGMDKRAKLTLWIIAFVLFAIGCFCGSLMVGDNPRADSRTSIPSCKQEDGSTQEICAFEGSNGRIINMDYGHYSFYQATGQIVDFQKGK